MNSDPTQFTHFFLGIDPAPAQSEKADDGALVAAKVFPRPGIAAPTGHPSDWTFAPCWAYRLRGASMRQWSGLVHRKHRDFNFTGILLDPGAGGGGGYLMTELKSRQQRILDIDVEVTPITVVNDETEPNGEQILNLWKRGDYGIDAIWPLLKGDDNLVDASHTVMQQSVEHGGIVFPKPFNERPRADTDLWPEEKQWALKNIDASRAQLEAIVVATKEGGEWELTARNARKFSAAKGKKDLATALILAYIRFLIWLQTNQDEFVRDNEFCGVYVMA
jgi:hypothetical protein